MKKRPVSVLITDLDNTLYDWFEVWYQSFRGMLTKLLQTSGVPEPVLIKEIKQIHQQHRTSEYLMLVSEIPSLMDKHPNEDLTQVYEDAIREYWIQREATLRLFPSVLETLKAVKTKDALVVGYTESQAFYSEFRVKYLGLDGILDILYSPEGHELPENSGKQLHFFPLDGHQLEYTQHRYTPKGEIKPNPDVLLSIIGDIGASRDETIYVGDNESKDIAMAQAASVTDVHAKYGVSHSKEEYELLRQVTHWTEEDVEKEKSTIVEPSFTLNESYTELLQLFEFVPFSASKQ
jgi:phosphoglycolate phosphatase